ncbi:MAG: hypothetical protein U9R28_01325 [Pseudomonadota bacterium]|nr:hypothetical protein [Pseudomonadota bacterium]
MVTWIKQIAMPMGLGVILSLLSVVVSAEDEMVRIFPKQLMLGDRVTLSISGDQAIRDFDKLDLTALKHLFAIHEIDVSSDRIRLRLYPLSIGLVEIPEMKAGAIRIPATQIEVKENPDVSIVWQPPKPSIYTAENTLWRATVEVVNDANQVRFQANENDDWNIQSQAQPVSESGGLISGKTAVLVANFQFNTDSLITTTKSTVIQSPAVVVKNTSNKRWLFFDSPHIIHIQPLPSFLPVNIPVGQVSLDAENSGHIRLSGDLNHWVWQLTGESVNVSTLDHIAHQLIAQIPHNEKLEWLTDSREVETSLTEEGLQSRLTVRLPYRVLQPGLFSLPELNLRYFDVKSGKLQSQTLASETQFALPFWLVWILQWVALIMGLAVLYFLLWQTKQAWLNWKLRQAMTQAENAEQLITAMLDWQQQQRSILKPNEQVARSISLESFQNWYEQRYSNSKAPSVLIESLNQTLYSQSDSEQDWPEIQRQAQAWIKTLPFWSI